jgi:hypothetical protein
MPVGAARPAKLRDIRILMLRDRTKFEKAIPDVLVIAKILNAPYYSGFFKRDDFTSIINAITREA